MATSQDAESSETLQNFEHNNFYQPFIVRNCTIDHQHIEMSLSYFCIFLLVSYAHAFEFDFDEEMMSRDFTDSDFSARCQRI